MFSLGSLSNLSQITYINQRKMPTFHDVGYTTTIHYQYSLEKHGFDQSWIVKLPKFKYARKYEFDTRFEKDGFAWISNERELGDFQDFSKVLKVF